MRKKLAKRQSGEHLVRRAKARFVAERQGAAKAAALLAARAHVLELLAALNDEARDPTARVQAQRRRGVLPIQGWRPSAEDAAAIAADSAAGAETAGRLLAKWDAVLVEQMIEQVQVKGAEYRVQSDGRVVLEPRLLSGPASALAALSLAQARDLLRSVDGGANPFQRRVKQCANPLCGKWFFDGERGTRQWCCGACGNAHRQLKFASPKKYTERLRSGEYARRRCPCSRPDCEG